MTAVISKVLKQLEEARVQVQENFDAAQKELDKWKAELARIDRILKAAEPPKKPAPRHRVARKSNVSDEKRNKILEILTLNPEGMTIGDIADAMGTTPSTVSYALNDLRQAELVRDAGRKPRENGTKGVMPKVWKVME